MVFAYVFVEGWVVHPDVYCFFDSSYQVLVLPPNNAVNGGTMTSYGHILEKGLQMFSETLSKYGPYTDNMFALENFAHTFQRQLTKVIYLKPLRETNQDTLMPKYNKLLMDEYGDTFTKHKLHIY